MIQSLSLYVFIISLKVIIHQNYDILHVAKFSLAVLFSYLLAYMSLIKNRRLRINYVHILYVLARFLPKCSFVLVAVSTFAKPSIL